MINLGSFTIAKNEQNDIWQTLSTRVNEGKSSTLFLKENDVFKLGRVVFLVKKVFYCLFIIVNNIFYFKIKNPDEKQNISYYSNFIASLKENYVNFIKNQFFNKSLGIHRN